MALQGNLELEDQIVSDAYFKIIKIISTSEDFEYFENVNYEQVRKILIADPRIGGWGLYDSLFAGGSCFIKDAASLAHQLESVGTHAHLVRGILEANVFQRDHFLSRAETEAHFEWSGKSIALLGTAFKQDTNDIRNSGAIGVIQQLLGSGVARITIYDPAAIPETQRYFNSETFSRTMRPKPVCPSIST
jgi:UDPglucose 6-dehydrogenase